MSVNRLKIGEMAELNNVSIQTLRLYDRNGLLKPYYVDEENNYRYYNINQSAKLDLILYLQRCGLTLEAIKELLEANDNTRIKQALEERLIIIEEEINHLKENKKAIESNIKSYDRNKDFKKDVIFLEYIEERYLYRYATNYNFFSDEHDAYEYMLREFKDSISKTEMGGSYFFNVGTMMRQDKLSSENYVSEEVFVFLDSSYQDYEEVETLPNSYYLCMCSDDFSKEIEIVKILMKSIKEQDYIIAGDYICEVITEYPTDEFEERHLLYKIQIPIKFN